MSDAISRKELMKALREAIKRGQWVDGRCSVCGIPAVTFKNLNGLEMRIEAPLLLCMRRENGRGERHPRRGERWCFHMIPLPYLAKLVREAVPVKGAVLIDFKAEEDEPYG